MNVEIAQRRGAPQASWIVAGGARRAAGVSRQAVSKWDVPGRPRHRQPRALAQLYGVA
ncbi:MAG: hypothetical protein ACLSVD_16350 [Eggerthellaceae bacterium]